MKSRALRYVAIALCASLSAVAVAVSGLTAPAEATTLKTSINLIRNAGAELTKTRPTEGGTKVVVTSWTVAKRYYFTAVRYGTPSFPAKHDPGPKTRGNNFFAGGVDGVKSIATQIDSLTGYKSWIKDGQTQFTLSGWLGGYSSQNDHAIVSATWQNKSGATLGVARIGRVSAHSRHDVTAMHFRSTKGVVPKGTTKVLIEIKMTRTDGAYNDGYADNLRLVLAKS